MRLRRKVLIRPRLQGKIVAVFLGAALVCLTVQGTLQIIALTRISHELPAEPAAIASQLMTTVLTHSMLGVMMLVPLMMLVGVMVTFRVAGPIHRMESYLNSYLRGEESGPCRIRKDDECQELCRLINDALAMERPTSSRACSPSEAAATPVETCS